MAKKKDKLTSPMDKSYLDLFRKLYEEEGKTTTEAMAEASTKWAKTKSK